MNLAEIGQDTWQPEAKMHGFKEGVVAITNDAGVELEDSSAPEVMDAILALPGGNVCEDIPEYRRQMLGAFARFGSVFSEIFEH